MKQTTDKKNLILRIAAVVFGIYLLYSLISDQTKIAQKKAELEELRTTYTEELIRNEELQKTVESYGTDEFIEEQAREKLGYAYEDEHFYIDISGSK